MPGSSSASTAGPAPVRLFYSYAHEDEKLRAELERHLKILQHRGLIQPWHDRAIVPGALWDAEIAQQLLQADLVLLLLSSYFMGSDYILGVELKTALRRAAEGSATVVPILLRPLDLDGLDSADLPMAPLLQRQGLPRDLKAVTSWRQREEAWVNVPKGLRATVAEDVVTFATLCAGEVAHVLHNAEQRHIHALEHVDALAGVDEGQVLRG